MKTFRTYFVTLKIYQQKIIAAIENTKLRVENACLPVAGMLAIFRAQATRNSHNMHYQFWRQDNQPKELYSPAFTVQKLNYVHNNPVEAGLVGRPEDYLYSIEDLNLRWLELQTQANIRNFFVIWNTPESRGAAQQQRGLRFFMHQAILLLLNFRCVALLYVR
jgi:hypothetical protein